ncbi:unnamed protein product [Tilletia controversa]|uniref:MICOS complex subunit n=2 Tax=Tilletia TaxID=13289 RepID=A0A8X7SZF9_9BASI|nr:hypothetical protein CF328_g1356 [Tilletia controversa]CAD6888096.1 unnamed protein product [Tilletia caries]KAE8253705.1 hypothetical protein A4X06_0g1264 [Tilletia controversa]CAD6899699.1 unnamed protein product [Tilletia caries]CAD6925974.1 unnamed protein product [Tilletia controversa]
MAGTASTSAHQLYEISLPQSLLSLMSFGSLRPAAGRAVHCEASSQGSSSSAQSNSSALVLSTKRLPIYDQPEQPITLVETHTELERQVGSIRRSLQSSASSVQHQVQDLTSSWIARERALEARVRSLSVPEEPANPGLLYVGVATLSASVFTRYRSFPIRFLAPPLFFVGSMNYFLPKTAANLSNYYEELENRYVPSLTGPRKSIIDATSKFWARTEGLVESARETASKGVKTGLQQVEQGTGLRVGEVLEHAKAETAQQLNGGRRSV